MRIVVVGNGKVGSTLTRMLAKEGHDVIIIDSNQDVVENLVNTHDIMGICGNGGSYEVLKDVGVDKADLFIAVTSGDELNILSCILARRMGARHTIARVRNPEYFDMMMFMRKELGLSMFINPEYESAMEISRILRLPQALEVDSFSKGRVDLVAVRVRENSVLKDQAIADLPRVLKAKILICAIERDDEVIIPDGNCVLRKGDKIYLTASSVELDAFFRETGIVSRKVHHVMIIGGGKIAFYLAKALIALKVSVKIIERDYKRCRFLSEHLPEATIIYGDGTDQKVLDEEGIAQADACVALTDNDEENIILSMYASTRGTKKNITKINRIAFLHIMADAGIESIISPKMITANHIVRYVRSMENTEDNSIRTLYKIVDGQAEAIEFPVTESFGMADKPLRDIEIRKNNLIACIIRRGKPIFPDGDAVLKVGDNVIVVSTDPSLKDLSNILKRRR